MSAASLRSAISFSLNSPEPFEGTADLPMRHKDRHNLMSDLARKLRQFTPTRKPLWIDRRRRNTKCIFCGGDPVTFEHIWPAWSHDYLPPRTKNFYWAIGAIRYDTWTAIHVRKKNGDPLDRQVDAVDERCNNGWMRKLIEDQAKDVLIRLFTGADNPTRITEPEQRLIASWIALRAIVAEYDDFTPRITHHKVRHMLWKTQRIPTDTWRVWIGNYEGRQAPSHWHEVPFLTLPDRVAKRKKTALAKYTNGQVLTYVIGKLLIHVMRCPNPVTLTLWTFPPEIESKLRLIWPPTGYSIVWPIPNLTNEEAHFVARAFGDYLFSLRLKPKGPSIYLEPRHKRQPKA